MGTASRKILVSYAGRLRPISRSWERRQRALARSAHEHGFDRVITWTRRRLMATHFYWRHRDVLRDQRGSGFWAWKPFIIGEAMREAREGDYVIYWDVGRGWHGDRSIGNQVRRGIGPLLRWCDDVGGGALPGTWIPQHGPNRVWTKRDAFVLMGCDEERFWESPQVQATFSIWRCEQRSREVVQSWKQLATDRRIVSDDPNTCGLPNLPGFQDHRHDQSILTNLVNQRGMKAPLSIPARSWDLNVLADALEGRG